MKTTPTGTHEISLKNLSEILSKKIGETIRIIKKEKVGSGYHSEGFKLIAEGGQQFFLKYVRSQDLGFEFPERRAASLMVSHAMSQRTPAGAASLGVVILNQEDVALLPELSEASKIYQLQAFAGQGTSYASMLETCLTKECVDDNDRQQLSTIADILVGIHAVKHPSKDPQQLTAIYNDALRSVLTHPELSIMALSEFPSDHAILDLEGQKELIGLMYENIKAQMGRGDRLVALHGDFWGANIFFRPDESVYAIDFSRIPWGDPAIDVGWFMSQPLWYYHLTGNPYFKELIEAWLDIYQTKSGENHIRQAVPLVLGWTSIVQMYPRWFPTVDALKGQAYIQHIKDILKHQAFLWKD